MCPDVRQRGHFHIFVGLALMAWGILVLLNNFGLIPGRELLRSYWPAMVLFWGAGLLLFGHAGQKVLGMFLTMFSGIFLLKRLYGWDLDLGMLIGPAILIFIGLRVMFGGTRRFGGWHSARHAARLARVTRRAARAAERASVHASRMANDASFRAGMGFGHGPDTFNTSATATTAADEQGHGEPNANTADPSAIFREFAFLGGIDRRNTSQTLRGGSATAFLGSVEIDLRECRMSDAGAQLDVFTFMGNILFRIPRDWTVRSEVAAVLGSFEDHSAPPTGEAKTLVITGQAIMGSIEIKN
jgi:hypothetical protein